MSLAISNPSRVQASTVVAMSTSVTKTVQQQQQHTFMVAARLPSLRDPGRSAGYVATFAHQRITTTITTQVTTSLRFVACSRPPQAKNPFRALFDRFRGRPDTAMLFKFEQQTTQQVTKTVSVMYFSVVCQSQERAYFGGAAPRMAPPPTPPRALNPASDTPATERRDTAATERRDTAATERRDTATTQRRDTAATERRDTATTEHRDTAATPESIEPSKSFRTADWQDLAGVKTKAARYDVWNALGEEKPRNVEIMRDGRKSTFTPQSISADGLSFTALNEDSSSEQIPFSSVQQLKVV